MNQSKGGFPFDYYRFIIDSCKKFDYLRLCSFGSREKYWSDDIWILIEACLRLDKIFGKENVRDEFLTKYEIYEQLKDDWDERKEWGRFYRRFTMINKENGVTLISYSNLDDVINNIIVGYIFNKLVDKKIISDDKWLKTAIYVAELFETYILNNVVYQAYMYANTLPCNYELLKYFYKERNMKIYIAGMQTIEWMSKHEKDFMEKKKKKIPECLQNRVNINERMTKLLENSDNIEQLICPDLVKVVLEDDFDQRLKRSFGKNKKVRPEILFDGYRKDTEVEDNKENTAQSDEDLDL